MKHIILLLLTLILCAANLFIGSQALSIREVIDVLMGGGSEVARFIILDSRLPALQTALLAGAALSVSGLIMQTLFRNPLADPSLLGVSSGAGFGAAVAMLIGGIPGSWMASTYQISGFMLTASMSFIGAISVIAVLLAVSSWIKDTTGLLIVGVMLSFLVSSATSLLISFASESAVWNYMSWGLGSFEGTTGLRLLCYGIAIAGILLLSPFLLKPLDAFLLGSNYAQSLGIPVQRWRTILLLFVGWLTALTTSVCGPIAFIGLAVPHGARMIMKTANHRQLVPSTILLGCVTTLACLLLTHLPAVLGITHALLPISALTPLIGAPIVIYILIKK